MSSDLLCLIEALSIVPPPNNITGALQMATHNTFSAFMLRRKINPSEFYSTPAQLEMIAAAKALGDNFWDHPRKGVHNG